MLPTTLPTTTAMLECERLKFSSRESRVRLCGVAHAAVVGLEVLDVVDDMVALVVVLVLAGIASW
jgi:hypothetical protein